MVDVDRPQASNDASSTFRGRKAMDASNVMRLSCCIYTHTHHPALETHPKMSTSLLSRYQEIATTSPPGRLMMSPITQISALALGFKHLTIGGEVVEDQAVYCLITQSANDLTPHPSHPDVVGKVRIISSIRVAAGPQPLMTNAAVVAIGIHKINSKKADMFESRFNAVKHNLEQHELCRGIAGGWRKDIAEGERQRVLLSGWDKVEDHGTFVKSPAFQEYSRIRPFVKDFEIKHIKLQE